MSDAPKRIWATVNGASTRLPDGGRQLIGGWSEDASRPRAVGYVRADIHNALVKERDALKADRDFWKEQFQVETRYRIELADKGTLQALTDANNRMSSAEAERDELHDTVRMLKKARDTLAADKAEFLAALRDMTSAFRPFTSKPIGAPHSPARMDQDHQIATHKAALALLAHHSAPKPIGEG